MSFHLTGTVMTVVELVRRAIMIPSFAHDQDVVAAAEWVWEDGNWAEVHIGVVTRRLTSRRAVEIPL